MPEPLEIRVAIPHAGTTIGGVWHPNEAERSMSFAVLVELSMRVPVIPLRNDEGLLEGALSSLASFFQASRDALKQGGLEVARNRPGELSGAILVGTLLNQVLRPITAYWHREMTRWTDTRPPGTSKAEWEEAWPKNQQLRDTLDELRVTLVGFAQVFAEASGAEEFLRTQLQHEGQGYDERRRARIAGKASGAAPP